MKRILILLFILSAMTVSAEYREESHYVAMRDGVALAVDVALPPGRTTERLPTIVTLTRYWRASEGRGPLKSFDARAEYKDFFTSMGYAVLIADVRGTGASYGTWPYPWSAKEISDGFDLVDWIIRQRWSNGIVGAMGDSYEGSTALFLAAANHPAVKAVAPRFIEYDLYDEMAFPGGVFNDVYIRRWSADNEIRDRGLICDERSIECFLLRLLIRGPRPVNGDRKRLRDAIEQHAENGDLYAGAKVLTSRDEVSGILGTSIDGFSLHEFRDAIERSGVAIFSWGSWMDGATADCVIHQVSLRNEQKALIGPWNHSATLDANPYNPPDTEVSPSEAEQAALVGAFFDHYLKGVDNGFDQQPPLLYFTMGENAWKATDVWPPSGVVTKTLFLTDGGGLSEIVPAVASTVRYTVDFTASTGTKNRYLAQLDDDVVYPDRAEEDRKLLTFTSKPLPEDVEITGNVRIVLDVTSSETDGAFHAYLEDVDETGRVTLLTEGRRRALHRKGTFLQKDAAPLVRDAVNEIAFDLIATSVRVKKGHRLRIAIAGHDASMFARIPANATPTIDIHVGSSRVELPVMQ